MARSAPSSPSATAAYSASVGLRPAKMSAARRSVLRHGAIVTLAKSVCGVSGVATTSSPSSPRKRSMCANSGVPAATCTPPPWATP